MNVTFRSQKHTTLAKVARQFGIAVTDILAANPNKQYSINRDISPGEEICVPFYSSKTGFSFGTESSTKHTENRMTKDEFENFFMNFGTFAVCLLAYRYKG